MRIKEIAKRVFNKVTGEYYMVHLRPRFPEGEKQDYFIGFPSLVLVLHFRGKHRIYNPVTGRSYEINQHSSKYTRPGEIRGLWSYDEKKCH